MTDVNLISNYIEYKSIKYINLLIKRDWQYNFTNDVTICYLQETHFRFKEINLLKVKG